MNVSRAKKSISSNQGSTAIQNVSGEKRNELVEILGLQFDNYKGVYLGMPYMIGR